jgi:hypothetical protein
MKNLLTVLLAAGLSTASIAQENSLQSGKIFAGGSVGFSSTWSKSEVSGGGTTVKEDGPKTTNFNVIPEVNYMLSEKLAVGLGIGYDFTKTTVKDREDEESDTRGAFIVAPNATYFIPFGNERFGLLVNAAIPISIGTMTEETKSGGTTISRETDMMGWGVVASPGIYYFASRKFMLTSRLGSIFSFSSNTTKSGESTTFKTTNYNLEVLNFSTLGLSFGGSFFF